MQPHPSRMELVQQSVPHLAQLPLAAAPPTLRVTSSTDPSRFFFVKSNPSAPPAPS
jgi:hypothetical protein